MQSVLNKISNFKAIRKTSFKSATRKLTKVQLNRMQDIRDSVYAATDMLMVSAYETNDLAQQLMNSCDATFELGNIDYGNHGIDDLQQEIEELGVQMPESLTQISNTVEAIRNEEFGSLYTRAEQLSNDIDAYVKKISDLQDNI